MGGRKSRCLLRTVCGRHSGPYAGSIHGFGAVSCLGTKRRPPLAARARPATRAPLVSQCHLPAARGSAARAFVLGPGAARRECRSAPGRKRRAALPIATCPCVRLPARTGRRGDLTRAFHSHTTYAHPPYDATHPFFILFNTKFTMSVSWRSQ